MEEKTIIALEIGSSKIKGAVGTVDPSGSLNVKAVEEERICDIVRYGCIRNVVETAAAVRNVVGRLEQRVAPRTIEGVYLSIGGRSLSASVITVERRLAQEAEITRDIIEDITDEALASSIPDRSVVSVAPRELMVDGSPAPRPVGMIGSHVGARLNLISCRTQLLRNLTRVIEERLGLKIADTFVRPLIEADLVLTPEEKRLGCMLVDFGAETTTVAIYKNGVLVHMATLPLGSRNITRDITSLNHLEERAEELKIQGGSAQPVSPDSSVLSGTTDFTAINNYVAARAGEIILNICEQVKYAGLTPDRLPEGIVIIGRGARLSGFNQRLEQLSGLKVRTGAPGNKVRILDGRVLNTDAVDVIAILAEAAKSGAVDCLSPRPQVHVATPRPATVTDINHNPNNTHEAKPEAKPEVKPEVKPDTNPEIPAQRVKPGGARPEVIIPGSQPEPREKSRWSRTFEGLRTRVANLLSDNLYEEDDE